MSVKFTEAVKKEQSESDRNDDTAHRDRAVQVSRLTAALAQRAQNATGHTG
ncbi:hypothetical protein [Ketobacter sp.]